VDWLLSRKAIFLENPIDTFIEFEDTLENMIKTSTDDRLIYSSFRQIFTHVRFKTVLEVRACDRQEKGDELTPAAFLSGLLTTEKVRDILMEELTSWTDSDRHCLSKSAQSVDFSNDGPKNKTIGYWLEYLCQLSLDGLDERSKILNIKNEKILLESKLKNLISQGTATRQIQDAYKKSGQTLKSFIRENYLDLYND
jgi:gamma-glutamylcysteine synthetase